MISKLTNALTWLCDALTCHRACYLYVAALYAAECAQLIDKSMVELGLVYLYAVLAGRTTH
ncbi:hypothetical protein ACS3SW_00705 [Roseobacteraceae bacterium S113]